MCLFCKKQGKKGSADLDSADRAAVGGFLCRQPEFVGDGVGDGACALAVLEGEYLRADAGTESAADAGFFVYLCVHNVAPFAFVQRVQYAPKSAKQYGYRKKNGCVADISPVQ